MFLRRKTRTKDGKTHRYWSVVENRRVRRRTRGAARSCSIWASSTTPSTPAGCARSRRSKARRPQPRNWPCSPRTASDPGAGVRGRAGAPGRDRAASRPRQWGACWLALHLWDVLELDRFWAPRLPHSRKGTRWLNVLKALSGLPPDRPGQRVALPPRVVPEQRAWAICWARTSPWPQKDKLYRCLDRLLGAQGELFDFLKERWGALFGATYRRAALRPDQHLLRVRSAAARRQSKKQFGYSRDHRPDCVQVVIALVVTPEGFPLAYEVYPGNTARHDHAGGLPGENRNALRQGPAHLADGPRHPDRRTLEADAPASDRRYYLVGTPKGR